MIDYGYYKNVFLGTLIPADSFYHIEKKAEAYVKYVLSHNMNDSSDVKNALCAVCELLYSEGARDGIKSENTDGYSVTFDNENDLKSKVFDVIEIYLAGTGLLYRGLH